jgi:hypothetical protein
MAIYLPASAEEQDLSLDELTLLVRISDFSYTYWQE